jgi:class 3 adenylate cyclase/tetratricopeptide (TPR) repeat protein
VVDCPRCGTANAADARFCSNCGNSLVTRVGVQERRVVTALFADLARSTSLGEKLDPEVVRGMVGRFFELAQREIEVLGGTVEKFSGDAVMAVFGVPTAHEDDPERAVRAAIGIRDGVASVALDTQERHGIELKARIGIESGEVVVGDPFGGATMATGDTMNVAARLEQLAEPGEIVIGAAVWEQVRNLATTEPLGELNLRGRDESLRGWRVTAVAEEVGRPRGVPGLEAPLTGRDEELSLLLNAARRVRQENKASLFTILGVPGLGKSRLVREASARLATDGWTIVKGRCLPYGEGITYWPVAEMVRELCGITSQTTAADASARLLAVSGDPAVGERLALIVGASVPSADGDGATAGVGTDREIGWGFRALLEHVAAERGPMMLIFEDIHWAEPPLLDLIEYVVTWTRGTPLLVVCPSRPELIDTRPSWGGGRIESSRISLEPLDEAESRSLLGSLLAVDDLPAELRQRILERAEGNPLFVEEVVRMLIEEGIVVRRDDHWVALEDAASVRVPESIEALIRARLDTLPAPERRVLQAAAVVGRVFQQAAVAAISRATDSGPLERHLEDAILRDLITEERVPAGPTFRFRHILIRDVAYSTLPKAHRAELHGAVADWLREWSGARIEEFVEIEAYHLEERLRLIRELTGRVDPADANSVANALAASAGKALARDDSRAALAFAERALAFDLPASEARLELEWTLVDALRRQGEYARSGELAASLEIEAQQIGRRDLEGRAIVAKASASWIKPENPNAVAAIAELRRARTLLEESGDDLHLLDALELLGYGGWWAGDTDEAYALWSEQRELARAHGWTNHEAKAVLLLARARAQAADPRGALVLIGEARRIADKGASRLTRARIERVYGSASTRLDPGPDPARALASALATLEEFGDREEQFIALAHLGDNRAFREDWEAALGYYERAFEQVTNHGGYGPEAQTNIARALLELGRIDEAESVAEEAVKATGSDDFATVASTEAILGRVREAQGRHDEAEQLLRDAAAVMARTRFNAWEQEAGVAEFLLRRGRSAEAQDWVDKLRATLAPYGPDSPLTVFAEHGLAQARELGEAR